MSKALAALAASALLTAPPLAASSKHFGVSAAFVPPAKAGASAKLDVTFTPYDPDVNVNEEPAPRLRLDPGQKVLVDKQPPPPARTPTFDPDSARYLDLALPVSFPVALAPDAPKGSHTLKASVTYFYCSKREGWCRKGTADLDVPVTVR
jgi:hypothetical protein